MGPMQCPELLGDMDGQTQRAAFGFQAPADGLPDPIPGVRTEAVAQGGVKLLHRPDQSERAFLHQVHQIQTPPLVGLGHRHHQAQVGLNHAFARPAAAPQFPLL